MISILLSARNVVVPQSRKCHVIGIESHLGPDKLVSEPRPTIGAPLIDRSLVVVESSKNYFGVSLYRGVGILFTPQSLRRSGEES